LNSKDVHEAMREKTLVEHNGIKYYITGFTQKIDVSGKFYFVLELHDLKANSVTIADINKVNLIDGSVENG